MEDAALHAAGDGDDLARDVAGEAVRGEHDDLRATSSGGATLRSGIVRVIRRTSSGPRARPRVIGDSVQPGATAFTRARGRDADDLVLEREQQAAVDRGLRGRVVGVARLAEDARRSSRRGRARRGRRAATSRRKPRAVRNVAVRFCAQRLAPSARAAAPRRAGPPRARRRRRRRRRRPCPSASRASAKSRSTSASSVRSAWASGAPPSSAASARARSSPRW